MATNFVQRMMIEHSELVERIKKLHNYIYSDASDKDDKVEFANKCIQLTAMKKYEEALRARLENQDIICENGEYFAHLAKPCINRCDGDCDNCKSNCDNCRSERAVCGKENA
jgi:hypothetical protein